MKNISKIVLDPFCFRQFDKVGDAPVSIDYDKAAFTEKINELYDPKNLREGYAPFCKHLFVKNFTPAKVGYAKIDKDNEHLLRTAYEARTDKELPVLVRFFPPGVIKPEVAEYLDIILYSKEQIQKENAAMNKVDPNAEIDYDWGIVSVKPQNEDYELKMNPITMMRNALGKEHGGSGVPLDREEYLKSVEFWSQHALVK